MHSTPERIGGYELIGRIASGGMAEVFLARRTGAMGFEKFVVVKKILPHLANELEFVTMFLDEARIAAQIHHSNVVQIYDLGQEGAAYYIVMEYLQGQSLSAALKFAYKRKLFPPFPIVARVIANACAGLHAAHELRDVSGELVGLVHRDVSPQNVVILYNGDVKLVDFGVAKARGRLTRTTSRSLKGKYAYMSPEQALGNPIDRRSDVFAMGVVLWECLAMKRLFQSESELAILRAITEAPTPPASKFREDTPESLDAIALKALAKDPKERYPSAAEMQRDLESALRTLPEGAGSSEVAAYMQRLFRGEITRSREVLAAAARGDVPTATANADVFAELRHDGSGTGPSGVSIAAGTRNQPAPVAQAAVPGPLGDEMETVASDVIPAPKGLGTGPLEQPVLPARQGTGPLPMDDPNARPPSLSGFPINPASGLSRARGEVLPALEEAAGLRRTNRILTLVAVAALVLMGVAAGWFLSTRTTDDDVVAAAGDTRDRDDRDDEDEDEDRDEDSDEDTDPDPETAAPATTEPASAAPETAAPETADIETADEKPEKTSPGYLNLETSPWTNVYLGRKKLGTTPLVKAKIPPGTHKLKLVNDKAGINVTKVVKIKRGKITRVRWRL